MRVRLLDLPEPRLLVVQADEPNLEEQVVVTAEVLDDHLAGAPHHHPQLHVDDGRRRDFHRPRDVLVSFVHLHPELQAALAARRLGVQQRSQLQRRGFAELVFPHRREPPVFEVHGVDPDDVVATVFIPVVELKLQLRGPRELGGELEHLVEPRRERLLDVVAPVAEALAGAE